MKLLSSFLLLLFLSLSISCENKVDMSADETSEPAPPDLSAEEVKALYERYVQGDYPGYVAHIQSAEEKPESYQAQMALLYKQHAADQKGDDGEVRDVEVSRIVGDAEGTSAEAYLRVTYDSGRQEEIYLQLVCDEGTWKVR